ncbi:metallophosphoesterase [Pedobacter sp. SYSU D00535]|uniref:metallophosphoesterase n=1 Tax=Pedobacter sp. SYSU D00535 TaxID=2810308 RepID=UPI001A96EB9D|nr:metallophosphoesterase [Pedobacter sp. SYSU D00535]
MSWTRRKFIKASLFFGAGLTLADAFWFEKYFIQIKEFFVGEKNSEEPKFRVVQVSDLHLRSITSQLKTLASRVNRLKADLIVFTGDSIDQAEGLILLDEYLEMFDKQVKKVAILGNWEYWGGVDIKRLKKVYHKHNCDLLVNETRRYSFRASSIAVTGLDDFVGGNADIELALHHFEPADFHMVLNHCPAYSDSIAIKTPPDINLDLILSGHTHGGQVNLFGLIPFLPEGSGSYVSGWYTGKRKKLYVSKGIGTSILPIRFGARSEIAVFNLG